MGRMTSRRDTTSRAKFPGAEPVYNPMDDDEGDLSQEREDGGAREDYDSQTEEGRRGGGDMDDDDAGGEEQEEERLFSCRIDNAKAVTTILSCLSHGSKKAQHARVDVSKDSIVFIVAGRAKFTQAQGKLQRELFNAFECSGDGGHFGVNLTTVLDCLQVYGPSSLGQTSLSMSYEPGEALLKLALEENGVFTSCEIRALHEEDDESQFSTLAETFHNSEEECRCILKSSYLKESFQELTDLPGGGSIKVLVSQTAPYFRLSATGTMGSIEIDFPKGSEAFVFFECKCSSLSWSYQLLAMESGMRALGAAHETYFRINTEGIICIQHQIPTQGGSHSFVDFLICAEESDEDLDGAAMAADGNE